MRGRGNLKKVNDTSLPLFRFFESKNTNLFCSDVGCLEGRERFPGSSFSLTKNINKGDNNG